MIAITGASGKTGRGTAELLLKRGLQVRVIGRTEAHLRPLVEGGAEPCVGDQGDIVFLTRALKGCDAAYILIPPKLDAENVRDYYQTMGVAVVHALRESGLRKVVFLSSLGAELDSGTGPVVGLHDVERMLGVLKQVDMVFLRAGYFYENTLGNIGLIREKAINGNPVDPDVLIPMAATRDISQKAAELLAERSFTGHQIEELFSERITYREATDLIAARLGMTSLPCVRFADQDAISSMEAAGFSSSMATSFVELAQALSAGRITTTIRDLTRPNGRTRFSTFVDEVFYPAYEAAAHADTAVHG
jgi:uncharacterized protein YbjT (DUF2867 family)